MSAPSAFKEEKKQELVLPPVTPARQRKAAVEDYYRHVAEEQLKSHFNVLAYVRKNKDLKNKYSITSNQRFYWNEGKRQQNREIVKQEAIDVLTRELLDEGIPPEVHAKLVEADEARRRASLSTAAAKAEKEEAEAAEALASLMSTPPPATSLSSSSASSSSAAALSATSSAGVAQPSPRYPATTPLALGFPKGAPTGYDPTKPKKKPAKLVAKGAMKKAIEAPPPRPGSAPPEVEEEYYEWEDGPAGKEIKRYEEATLTRMKKPTREEKEAERIKQLDIEKKKYLRLDKPPTLMESIKEDLASMVRLPWRGKKPSERDVERALMGLPPADQPFEIDTRPSRLVEQKPSTRQLIVGAPMQVYRSRLITTEDQYSKLVSANPQSWIIPQWKPDDIMFESHLTAEYPSLAYKFTMKRNAHFTFTVAKPDGSHVSVTIPVAAVLLLFRKLDKLTDEAYVDKKAIDQTVARVNVAAENLAQARAKMVIDPSVANFFTQYGNLPKAFLVAATKGGAVRSFVSYKSSPMERLFTAAKKRGYDKKMSESSLKDIVSYLRKNMNKREDIYRASRRAGNDIPARGGSVHMRGGKIGDSDRQTGVDIPYDVAEMALKFAKIVKSGTVNDMLPEFVKMSSILIKRGLVTRAKVVEIMSRS